MSLSCYLCLLLIGKPGIPSDSLPALGIHCSDKNLETGFYWAQQKAAEFVKTAGTGPINVWKAGQESVEVGYIPSYQAGYPLRSAFYSRDFCHQAPGAHLLGLDEENFSMLHAFAASSSADKKWYPLWALNFDGSPYTLDYKNDTNFVREVPAVFELLELMARLYRWTGDQRYLTDSTLLSFARHTLTDFIQLHDTVLPNGIAEGSGTGQIFKGVATYNEQPDYPLVEAGDGFAAQYAALRAADYLRRANGSHWQVGKYAREARRLHRLFQQEWGVNGEPTLYNRGYLRSGQPVAGWGKENSWFMLMKGLADPESKRTQYYLDFIQEKLTSKEDIPDNIEAITYIPETFFKYHRNEEGWQWMHYILERITQSHIQENLTGTNGDYPEVSFVLLSNIVEQLLGVEPEAAIGKVKTLSHLPKSIQQLTVRGIPIGKSRFTISHLGTSQSTLEFQGGTGVFEWLAAFPGKHPTIWVNERPVRARMRTENGVVISYCRVLVQEGKRVVASTSRLPVGGDAAKE